MSTLRCRLLGHKRKPMPDELYLALWARGMFVPMGPCERCQIDDLDEYIRARWFSRAAGLKKDGT